MTKIDAIRVNNLPPLGAALLCSQGVEANPLDSKNVLKFCNLLILFTFFNIVGTELSENSNSW